MRLGILAFNIWWMIFIMLYVAVIYLFHCFIIFDLYIFTVSPFSCSWTFALFSVLGYKKIMLQRTFCTWFCIPKYVFLLGLYPGVNVLITGYV